MDNLIAEYKNLCRICICSLDENSSITNIFDGNINNISLVEIIVSICSLDIFHHDNLPDKICNKCLEYLKISYEFKKMCKESDQELRARLHTYMRSNTKQECKNEIGCLSEEEIEQEAFNGPDSDSSEDDSKIIENSVDEYNTSLHIEVNKNPIEEDFLETNSTTLEETTHKDLSRSPSREDVKYCPICNLEFKSVYKYERHKETHLKRTYTCTDCKEIFTSKKDFTNHKNTHPRELECLQCGKLFGKTEGLSAHMKVHLPKISKETESSYECTICSEASITMLDCKKHKKLHEKEELKCENCDEKFFSKSKLLSHSKIHKEQNDNTKMFYRIPERKKFICEICKKKFKTKVDVELHKTIHDNPLIKDSIDENEKSNTENDEENQECITIDGKNIYKCGICLETFTNKRSFQKHKYAHKEKTKKQLTCEVCNAKFSLNCKFILHMNKHKGIKPYLCKICNKGFYLLDQLKSHTLIHGEESLFLCSFCGKSFKARTTLNEHLQRHSGIRKYVCSLCPSRFVCKGDLNSHMRTHDKSKCHPCNICGSTFAKPSYLEKHYRTHNKRQTQPLTFIIETEKAVESVESMETSEIV